MFSLLGYRFIQKLKRIYQPDLEGQPAPHNGAGLATPPAPPPPCPPQPVSPKIVAQNPSLSSQDREKPENQR